MFIHQLYVIFGETRAEFLVGLLVGSGSVYIMQNQVG